MVRGLPPPAAAVAVHLQPLGLRHLPNRPPFGPLGSIRGPPATSDRRLILKRIPAPEKDQLVTMAEAYVDHVLAGPTLLSMAFAMSLTVKNAALEATEVSNAKKKSKLTIFYRRNWPKGIPHVCPQQFFKAKPSEPPMRQGLCCCAPSSAATRSFIGGSPTFMSCWRTATRLGPP
jgi:hypothetical protein